MSAPATGALSERHCKPCEGGVAPLSLPEAQRALSQLSGEWQLICATHNLMLAVTSGHLTPQALTALAR